MPSSKAIEAGRAVLKLGLTGTKGVEAGLKKLQKMADGLGSKFKAAGSTMMAAGGVVTAGVGVMVKSFVDAGGAIDDMSQRTGVAAEAISELSYAAQLSGTDIAAVERALQGMSKQLLAAQNGSKGAVGNLDALGLSIEALKGLSPDAQFTLIAQKLSEIEDPTVRSAMAMKVFGKSGAELLPMLANGAAGIEKLRAEARDMGVVMGTEDVAASAALGDAIDKLWIQVKGMAIQVGAALAGPMTDFLTNVQTQATEIISWVKNNRELVATIAKIGAGLAAMGAVLYGTGAAFSTIATVIGGVTAAANTMRVAMALATANPIILAIGAVTGAIAALVYMLNRGSASATSLGDALNRVQQQPTAQNAQLAFSDRKQLREEGRSFRGGRNRGIL